MFFIFVCLGVFHSPKKINSVVLLCFHFCNSTSFFLGVNFAPSYIDNCTFTQNANPRQNPCAVPFIPTSLKLLHRHVSIHSSLSSIPAMIKKQKLRTFQLLLCHVIFCFPPNVRYVCRCVFVPSVITMSRIWHITRNQNCAN